jgi:hypothetical protein
MTKDAWHYLTCPGCRTRLRIKSEYTSMRGRCPSCGFRIEPADPKPLAFALNQADEPAGLVPEDEEWPEPADVMDEIEGRASPTYQLTDAPLSEALASAPTDENDTGTYNLAFDPSAPILPGVSRSAEWDQKQAPAPAPAPAPGSQPPADLTPFKLADAPALPQSEKIVDPLFGEEVVITRPAPAPSPPQTKPAPSDAPPPVARLATGAEIASSDQQMQADRRDAIDRIERDAQETYVYKLSEAELNPVKTDPPPKALFFDGVWSFPWRAGNRLGWFWISIGFTILTLQIWLILFVAQAGMVGIFVAGLIGVGALWVTIWTYSFAGAALLNIVTFTAAGSDAVQWPDDGWREWFFASLRPAYYYLVAMVAAWPLFLIGLGVPGWLLAAEIIFPAFLFSGLASLSFMNFLHPQVMKMIGQKIHLYAIMSILNVLLWAAAGTLSYYAFQYILLVPLAGIANGYAWVVYSRLLGRMAYTLAYELPGKKKKRKKKKPPAGEPEPASPDDSPAPQQPAPSSV